MATLGAAPVGAGIERLAPVDAMLAQLLAMMDNPAAAPGRTLTARSLRDYLQDRLAEPSGLDAPAEHFGVSRSHLCREARRLLGDTLVRTWERMKMDWARVLLGEASLSVAQVARRVGYADPFYFSKVFRAHAGSSPSDWRKAAGAVRD